LEARAEIVTDCPLSSFGAVGEAEAARAGFTAKSTADVALTVEATLSVTDSQ
jgi:hypothetical protein